MKQDEIIEMARQAGIIAIHTEGDGHWHQQFIALEAFAKLVAAKEREACAKLCESGADAMHPTVEGHVMKNFGASTHLAQAIRARGEA